MLLDLRALVDRLHALTIGRESDLTLLIDMDPETGLNRALSRGGREERFEGFGAAMQVRMRAAFLALAAEFPARFRIIDGNCGIDAVASDIRAATAKELKATSLLTMPIGEGAVKISEGPPGDDEEDYALPIWAGLLPVATVLGPPQPCPRLAEGVPLPDYLRPFAKG